MLLCGRLKAVSQAASSSRRQPSGLSSTPDSFVRYLVRGYVFVQIAEKGGLLRMNRRVMCVAGMLATSVVTGACSIERSSDPLTPTVAGPIPGVVITAPKAMQPPNGAKVGDDKPLSFTVASASTSGVRPFTYFIEIASNVDFTNVVLAKGGFAPSQGPETTFVVPDRLASNAVYFWRVKADDGANASAFSAAAQFTVFTVVTYEPPGPVAPVNGTTVSNLRPRFSWANATKNVAPADGVRYEIQLSDTDTFGQKVSATVGEDGSGRTSVDAPQDLPVAQQAFWKVRAFDDNNVGPWSAVQTFKTPARASGTGGCSFPKSPAEATTEEWRVCVFSLIDKRGVGPTVTIEGIWTLRPELNAMGADWQNGWRGDPRPRIFLPVPNCPSATNPSPPACAYSRTVDMGDFGGPWLWIPR
jgi:hypothetical protein